MANVASGRGRRGRGAALAALATMHGGLMASGCGSADLDANERVGSRSQTLVGHSDSFFYLRCNATGWALSADNELTPLGDGRLLSLGFEVTEPWMVANGDGCNVTETSIRRGWSSETYSWTTRSGQALDAPGTEPMVVGSQHFGVRYSALGRYRAVFDRSSGSLTIAPPGKLAHPFSAPYAEDWVNGGHIDLDPTAGVRDYAGFERTYDGHTGVDFGIGSFRAMDEGVRVVAAAAGTVLVAEDRFFDRVTDPPSNCGDVQNLVRVEAADGSVYDYAHLAQDSVPVAVGESVSAGQLLGLVGSSGCSSGPHLHFEIRDPLGVVLDPFELGLWEEPLPYAPAMTVMETVVTNDWVEDLSNPPDSSTRFSPGDLVVLQAFLAGGDQDDVFTLRLVTPSGDVFASGSPALTKPEGQTVWQFGWFIDQEAGAWKAEFVVNGTPAKTRTFLVE